MTILEQRVLSQALEQAIGTGQVRTAVFVTYQFDPSFFEHSVLPLLFQRAFSEGENVRRAQLSESLEQLDHVAVYYDRHGLIGERGPARLDYQRFGLSMRQGVLHAKNVLLLVDDVIDHQVARRLVVLTTSANITRSGWWENAEVAHVHTIQQGALDSLCNDLRSRGGIGLLRRLRKLDGTRSEHAALRAIEDFLRTEVTCATARRKDGLVRPRLYVGRQSVVEFIGHAMRLDVAGCNLEIIAPYFEDTTEAKLLTQLQDALSPAHIRIHLPRDNDRRVLCSEAFYHAVRNTPGVTWGVLPGQLTRLGTQDRAGARFVHAKVYRFFSPTKRREIVLAGSINFTRAAHVGAARGNFESAVLIETKPKRRPDWWMAPEEELHRGEFVRQRPEDDVEALGKSVLPLTLRFDWATATLSYFWEDESDVPGEARAFVGGIERFRLPHLEAGTWIPLSAEIGHALRELLKTNSFIDIAVDAREPVRVLVQEENMSHKPSLLEELAPEEILEYWSLLTPEQRDAFLETKFVRLLTELEGAEEHARRTPLQVEPTSMFDRFAGVFHAFSCLEERIDGALQERTLRGEKQAVYRLFGEKHDSLGALLDKLLADDPDADPVIRYLSMLSARELVRRLERSHHEFFQSHRRDVRKLTRRLKAGDKLRGAFSFGTRGERKAFLDWLERMFRRRVKLPEEAVA